MGMHDNWTPGMPEPYPGFAEEWEAVREGEARIEENRRALAVKRAEARAMALPVVDAGVGLTDRARAYEPVMIDNLASLAVDERQSGAARVAASAAVLDRSAGKAVQQVVVTQDGDTLGRIVAEVRALRERMYGGDAARLPVIDVDGGAGVLPTLKLEANHGATSGQVDDYDTFRIDMQITHSSLIPSPHADLSPNTDVLKKD